MKTFLIKFGVKTRKLPKPILPVHVLAESVEGARKPALVDLKAVGPEAGEALESTNKHALRAATSNGLRRVETTGDSSGGQKLLSDREHNLKSVRASQEVARVAQPSAQKPFDKKAYQRDYMRKRRNKEKK